ncbi:MAG: PVC-type heme-binding CxxCH protein [Planctomycetota bacterium]
MRLLGSCLICVCFTIACPSFAQDNAREPVRDDALSPSQSVTKFVLGNASQSIRLLAVEPFVVDPVEVQFDDAGRLWVVEMRDYPMLGSAAPKGRIRILSDTDQDGVFDSASIFADELNMPTGLYLWKDGAVVTVAGELIFLRDCDGNGYAESAEQWLTGFKEDNEQLRANHPRLGVDGWWYIACGLRGGNVTLGRDVQGEERVLQIGSRDIRFRPESGELEPITGPAQFGLCFDAFGERYFCSNRNPAVQVLMQQNELQNNPLSPLQPAKQDVIPAGENSQVYPIVDAWTTSNLHAGQFTAACGVLLRSGHLEGQCIEEVYACEPTGSLVKREYAHRTLSGLQILPNDLPLRTEWLASSDPWFRPVNLCLAPTGEMVVVDMHRAVIEHPRWVPDELKNRPDERWGNTAGRVYLVGEKVDRIAKYIQELQQRPLSQRSLAELIELAGSNNAWQRETATRLLLETRPEQASHLLAQIAVDKNRPLAARVTCLRLGLTLQDTTQSGLRAAEKLLLSKDENDELKLAVLKALRQRADTSAYQSISNYLSSPPDDRSLVEALRCMSNRPLASLPPEVFERINETQSTRMLVAACGSMNGHSCRFLSSWLRSLANSRIEWNDRDDFIMEAATRLTQAGLKANLLHPGAQRSLFPSKLRANRSYNLAVLSCWVTILEQGGRTKTELFELESKLEIGRKLLAEQEADNATRALAARVLGARGDSDYWPDLKRTAEWFEDSGEEGMFLEAWFSSKDPAAQDYLLGKLSKTSLRQTGMLVQYATRSKSLLNALCRRLGEDKSLAKNLGIANLRLLREKAVAQNKEVLSEVLSSIRNSDRTQVLERYHKSLELDSNTTAGRAVFQKNCASCQL